MAYAAISTTKGFVEFVITDNGVGREQAAKFSEDKGNHRSLALEITKERLSLINKSAKHKAYFTIDDLIENNLPKGTKVIINLPLNYQNKPR